MGAAQNKIADRAMVESMLRKYPIAKKKLASGLFPPLVPPYGEEVTYCGNVTSMTEIYAIKRQENQLLCYQVETALSELTKRERDIIEYFYFTDEEERISVWYYAKSIGITERHFYRIKSKALDKIEKELLQFMDVMDRS
jgi:hypothetical protein